MATSENVINLQVRHPEFPPRNFSLDEEKITIGRSGSCTLPITDPFLSRHHAEIIRIGDEWFVADSGSVNGTYLNGVRVSELTRIEPGDSITIGDNEIVVMHEPRSMDSGVLISSDHLSSTSFSLPVTAVDAEPTTDQGKEQRLVLVNRLMMELLEEKPMAELFDFIVEKVMDLLTPSRVALGILAEDRTSFSDVRVRRDRTDDTDELLISQTLLNDVVGNRRAVSFTDDSSTDLARAKSIAAQSIRSALCAPIIVRNEVMGVLYIDYVLVKRTITEDDVKLIAQIAQIAARKLETTLLREEVDAKRKMDEELKTAFLIQSRLLPASAPRAEGYLFAGHNRPCRTVSGDYYDFVTRPDGRVYVMIADVSGKGITAALVMAGVAAAFNTLTLYDHGPSRILADLNEMLVSKTDASIFVTAFCAVVTPSGSSIFYSNAGHNPPMLVTPGGVEPVEIRPGLALGFMPGYSYQEGTIELEEGTSLYLYTDGITEASNPENELFEIDRLATSLTQCRNDDPRGIALATIAAADEFVRDAPQADDMTVVCVKRIATGEEASGDETAYHRKRSPV